MEVKLSDIPDAVHLPRVNWNVVGEWVEHRIPVAERSQAWQELAMEWLDQLDRALGQRYRLVISDNLMLFAPESYDQATLLVDFAEAALKEIVGAIGSLSQEARQGPLLILLFEDADTYCLYTSPFDPEGEFFRSGGMCLRDGYTHIALRPSPLNTLQPAMLHEITHACLSHLNLPLWLEEGITQLAEEATVPASSRFALSREDAALLRGYWQEHGLNEFWWGRGFFLTGDGQHSNYQLAQVLFRLIVADHRQLMPEFVRRASADDAGDCAAREVLGKSLAEIAGQFLGQGDWQPRPIDCPTYIQRGNFCLARQQFDKALADFNAALRLDDRSSEALTNRGVAFYELGDIVASNADYERALELNPKDYHACNNLAWCLATCIDDTVRNGTRAVALATKACELSNFSSWFCLATLGAAYAEVADFEEALRWARESKVLAPEEEQFDCQERLKLYKSQQPYRDPPKLTPNRSIDETRS